MAAPHLPLDRGIPFKVGVRGPFVWRMFHMKPTRVELLLAWITLVKMRETYQIDAADDQFLLATLNIVDKYQHKLMVDEETAIHPKH